jgi:hypothetical protein
MKKTTSLMKYFSELGRNLRFLVFEQVKFTDTETSTVRLFSLGQLKQQESFQISLYIQTHAYK